MLWSVIKNFARKAGSMPGGTAGKDLLEVGIGYFNGGDFAAASRCLAEAHAADPDDVAAVYFLALAEARSGRLEQAEELLAAACAQRADADFHNALGNVRRLRGRLDEAATSYRLALEIDGTHLSALANLGLALRDQGLPQQAVSVLDRALLIAPDHAEAIFNKALALIDLGEHAPADALIERTLGLDPEFAQAHMQRGFLLLKRGDFAAGWREYAWRVRIPDMDHWQDYDYPLWQGESLRGRRVLVQAEQGLGDQIMFASCLPDLLERARHTVIECDPRLARLFARSYPSAVIYRHRVQGKPDWWRDAAPDYRVRLGDLPRILRTHEADFPPHCGYLVPDAGKVAAWRARLAALGPGLKVGISWRGGTPGTGQAARSIALAALLPILSLPRAHFISLQYGDVSNEIAELHTHRGVEVHAWSNANADMDGVAALIASLDLVVTVCTTAAHLAGALGKTAWVMVPAAAEWRYGESGPRIPWYPALRLFRQQRRNEWDGVIAALKAEFMHAIRTGGE
jgi:tetratricopeptide (TPR) repeat protein